jgi:hypothetical protein
VWQELQLPQFGLVQVHVFSALPLPWMHDDHVVTVPHVREILVAMSGKCLVDLIEKDVRYQPG